MKRVYVEVLERSFDQAGRPNDVGWRTDSVGSRYWSGRRWQELQERDVVARLVDARGDLVQL